MKSNMIARNSKLEAVALAAQATIEAVADELRQPAWAQRTREAQADDLWRANKQIEEVRLALFEAQVAARFIGDGIDDDFEELGPAEWPAWTDESRWTTTEPTPDDVLALDFALELPALCGGAPEPFVPSQADWDDYASWLGEDLDGRLTEADVITATGCA